MGKTNRARRWSLSAGLFAALLGMPGALRAQDAPPPADPRPDLPTRPEVDLPAPPPDRRAPPSSVTIDDSRALATASCPLAERPITVTLTNVSFEPPPGGTIPPPIEAILAGVRIASPGPQPIAAVCDVRDAANRALREAGYVASVQILPQEIRDGTLRLLVVSARLVGVRVTGSVGRFRAAIQQRADALMAIDPLNRFEAERVLLLASDVPGMRLKLTLQPAPGGTPGEVIGVLEADTQSIQLLANVQNYGSRQLGREIVSLRAEAYGLTGLDDRTFLSLSNSLQWDETHVIQAGHDMGLGGDGFRVGVRASYALSNPDLEDLDLRSRSLIAGIDLSMPLIRAVSHTLRARGGFEWLDQRTVFHNSSGTDTPYTRDRLRILFARLEGNVRQVDQVGRPVWTLDGYVQVRKGLNIFNASQLRTGTDGGFRPSRSFGNPFATVISGEMRPTLYLGARFSLEASLYGQWASDPLLNLEEFSFGSLTYGLGYDPGSNGADRVLAARIQPRIRLVDRGQIDGFDLAVDVTGFFDWARIYNLDPNDTENDRTLRSAGGGLRIMLPNRAVLDILYAKPLDHVLSTQTDQPKPTGRLLISLTFKLLPWGTN